MKSVLIAVVVVVVIAVLALAWYLSTQPSVTVPELPSKEEVNVPTEVEQPPLEEINDIGTDINDVASIDVNIAEEELPPEI